MEDEAFGLALATNALLMALIGEMLRLNLLPQSNLTALVEHALSQTEALPVGSNTKAARVILEEMAAALTGRATS